jgi:hypothetical protein
MRKIPLCAIVFLCVLPAASSAQTALVGSPTIQPFIDYVGAGTAAAFKETAANSGTVDTLNLYIDSTNGATTITLGLYNDNYGNPKNLLASAVLKSPAKRAWNSVSIPPTTITLGAVYWLVLLGNGGNCSVVQTSGVGSLTELPPIWPQGSNFPWCNPSFFAWHQGGQIAVTISPTSATVSTAFAQQFTAAVSNCRTNCGVNWSVRGNGSIDANGLYTAPATAEIDTVTAAAEADLTKTASATVTVTVSTLQHTVTLNWNDSNPVTFNVYRSPWSGGPYSPISSGLSLRCYVDSTVQSGHTYYYVVTAVDSSGESAYSNQVRAVVPYP